MTMHAPARRRRVLYDARDIAERYREVFTKKAPEGERELPFTWPASLQRVGDSLAVSYDSDKWQAAGDMVLYKHLAESRNRFYCKRRFLYEYESPKRGQDPEEIATRERHVIGPTLDLRELPMPKHFSFLALFVDAHVVLHDRGTDQRPRFSDLEGMPAQRIVVRHGLLGASKIRWSQVSRGAKDQPFLFVYSEPDPRRGEPGGVHFLVTGDELDIEADGIVG